MKFYSVPVRVLDRVFAAMSEPSPIEAASKRLALALDSLAAAVDRRQSADRGEQTLAGQLHALAADRSRLAAELDAAAAHRLREPQHDFLGGILDLSRVKPS